MPFERSQEIERRLSDVLRLIATGQFSTPKLAEEVGVSIPTISRIVAALRERGHRIQAQRHSGGWHYFLPTEDERTTPPSKAARRAHRSRQGQT